MDSHDLIAIARLMGTRLKNLEIPECCIYSITEADVVDYQCSISDTVSEV